MARVFDGFTFFNEIEILEIRLREHWDFVDTFVIVEADLTFQGHPKPLYFEKNKNRFRRYLSKIRHIVVTDMPTTDDPWMRERFQREAIRRGLFDHRAEDTVLISDADEITTGKAVGQTVAAGKLSYFEQRIFAYFLNWERCHVTWTKMFGGPAGEVLALPDWTQARREHPPKLESLGTARIQPAAGWHFSWAGDMNRLMTKFATFSHTEEKVQVWANPEKLAGAIKERRYFLDGSPLVEVPLTTLPETIMRNARALQGAGLLP